jgi:predicted ATP-dependent serine protease
MHVCFSSNSTEKSKSAVKRKTSATDSLDESDSLPPPPSSKLKGRSRDVTNATSSGDWSSTVSLVEKSFGKGSVMKLDEFKALSSEDVISTGSLATDLALGIGGVPRGRIVEIYGPESSGKTSLALSIIGQAHKMGGRATFIDAEHALDPMWAKRLGVKLDELLLCQPDSGLF